MDKDWLTKKFYDSLKAHQAKKIDELLEKKYLDGPNQILAIGNPDDPSIPTWKGAKPSQVIFDEVPIMNWAKVPGVPDSWAPIGYVNDTAIQWELIKDDVLNNIKALQQKLEPMALNFQPIEPVAPPSQKCYFGIKDSNGKEVKVPVIGLPELTKEYHLSGDAPTVTIENADIVVENIYIEYSDGTGVSVVNGPFLVKDKYNSYAEKLPQFVQVAESITVEHNGQYLKLYPGDNYTMTYDVDMAGKKIFNHNETVKIVEFNYGKGTPQPNVNVKPSPFMMNKAADSLKAKTHESSGTWTFDWIEKLECFIISGYFGKNRYEIVLGTPHGPFSDLIESLKLTVEIPISLRNMIHQANKALGEHFSSKADVFKHPKLHNIIVSCPGGNLNKDWHTCGGSEYKANLYNMIQHLNDVHKWTREAIAEWIDTLDEQPVFYPIIESQRVANSAKVVVCEPPV